MSRHQPLHCALYAGAVLLTWLLHPRRRVFVVAGRGAHRSQSPSEHNPESSPTSVRSPANATVTQVGSGTSYKRWLTYALYIRKDRFEFEVAPGILQRCGMR